MSRGEAWEGLSPPYGTIVADPPWDHSDGTPPGPWSSQPGRRHQLAYSTMTLQDITGLPVVDLAARDACLFLWTTNRYLPAAFDVLRAWGFTYSTTLVWAKPLMGWRPGGAFSITTEFVLHGRRGSPGIVGREFTTWWNWSRGPHSSKPPAFLDVVEATAPGPRCELFARAPRLGWDHWGHGYEIGAA